MSDSALHPFAPLLPCAQTAKIDEFRALRNQSVKGLGNYRAPFAFHFFFTPIIEQKANIAQISDLLICYTSKNRFSGTHQKSDWLIPLRLIQYGENNRSAFWRGRGKHMMSLFYHSPQYLFTEGFEQTLFLYRGIIERLP